MGALAEVPELDGLLLVPPAKFLRASMMMMVFVSVWTNCFLVVLLEMKDFQDEGESRKGGWKEGLQV